MLVRLEGCRLHQWETGRHIAYMLDGCADGPVRFQFAMRGMCEAWEVEGDGERCRIPDELLQRPGVLRVWLVVGGEVVHEESYDVEQRPKPSGYVCEPTEYETVAELNEWVRDYLDGVLGVTGVGGVETLPPGLGRDGVARRRAALPGPSARRARHQGFCRKRDARRGEHLGGRPVHRLADRRDLRIWKGGIEWLTRSDGYPRAVSRARRATLAIRDRRATAVAACASRAST